MKPPPESEAAGVVVFAGPSWPPPLRSAVAGLEWRGPAIAGDMLRLLAAPPRCVAIVDGLFDQAPAVRHKEILLLLSRGVHVLGAASMGALRAAELAPFGMVGVGRVYRAYCDGRLTRDDEVALLHAPRELDWAPFTIPLVNVRATLVAAVRARRVPPGAARRLLHVAAGIFYQERTWDLVISHTLKSSRHLQPDLVRLTEWLPHGAVDIKRLDAETCIESALRLNAPPAVRPAPPDTLFTRALERTLSE